MTRLAIRIDRIGTEGEPLVTIDDFTPDADALRAYACAATFGPAAAYYPGVRAELPEGWLGARMPTIARAAARAFGAVRQIEVIDASFSIVTSSPDALAPRQRIPHVDAFGRERIALLLYLSPHDRDGTAFFRHRPTGWETIDATRARPFFAQVEAAMATDPPHGYIAGDTAHFERIALAEARYNRALLYRGNLLHSGAIAPDAALSADPATGRLTVTAFLAIS